MIEDQIDNKSGEKKKGKQRRARKDRSSLGGNQSSSFDNEDSRSKHYELSPNQEPRSLASIPKPLDREQTPQRST
jgi:hypothetical protein